MLTQSSWILHDQPILFQFSYGDISGILFHSFNSIHHNIHNKGIWIHPFITDFRSFAQTNCRRCIKPDRLQLAAKWVFLKSSAVSRVPLWKDVTTVIRCFVKLCPCWIFYRRRKPWAKAQHVDPHLHPFSGDWCRTPTPALWLLGTLLWFGKGGRFIKVHACFTEHLAFSSHSCYQLGRKTPLSVKNYSFFCFAKKITDTTLRWSLQATMIWDTSQKTKPQSRVSHC